MKKQIISSTLNAILKFTKTDNSDQPITWKRLVDEVLGKIYHYDMRLLDVMRIVIGIYEEAIMEPRFQMPCSSSAITNLIFAPIKGHYAIDGMFGPKNLNVQYTVEQFYEVMLKHMLSDLMSTNIGWLRGDPITADWLDAEPISRETENNLGNQSTVNFSLERNWKSPAISESS